jgi:hypothetical protein
MTDELRNGLWNVLDVEIWSSQGFMSLDYRFGRSGLITDFSVGLWFGYFKKPIDQRPKQSHKILSAIRAYFFTCEWSEVYDFLEWVVGHESGVRPKLAEHLNLILEMEVAGYRFVSGKVVDITSVQELEMLDAALGDKRFPGVAAHLQRALELYASRDNPDYRNSIKESVSAVESIAKVMANSPSATLADALKTLDKQGQLHPALREGFIKLYGYTSDEGGIRHAMLDEPSLTANDARFFLLSCTSFVNYLKGRLEAAPLSI